MIIKNDFSNERDYRQDKNKNKVYIIPKNLADTKDKK